MFSYRVNYINLKEPTIIIFDGTTFESIVVVSGNALLLMNTLNKS